jgi:hypothetical protein
VYVFELRPHSPRLLVGFLAELDPAPHSSSQVAPRSSHSKTTFAKVPIRLSMPGEAKQGQMGLRASQGHLYTVSLGPIG